MTAKKSAAPAKAVKATPTAKSARPAKAEAEDKKKASAKAVEPVKAAKGSPPAKAADAAKGKPGRKGKADEKSKKEEVVEEDFSDIEAELEGEPEVEAAEEGETKAKAKPLRMKVSRAKERALMREFGLDETALTEEEVAKRRQELKTLIKMGKTRGFLTHQEINDHLPEKLVDNEILEAIVSMLNDMGIAVYEQAPDAATLRIAVMTASSFAHGTSARIARVRSCSSAAFTFFRRKSRVFSGAPPQTAAARRSTYFTSAVFSFANAAVSTSNASFR